MNIFVLAEMDCDMIQISAVCDDQEFSKYILPDQEIGDVVATKTQITKQGGKLFYKDDEVISVDVKTALQQFLEFLKKFTKPVLVAHNCKKFDSKILMYQFKRFNMVDDFRQRCDTFSDTVPFMMHVVPGRTGWGNYTQDNLVKDLLGAEYIEDAHNAITDTRNLQQLVKKVGSEDLLKTRYSFTLDSVLANVQSI